MPIPPFAEAPYAEVTHEQLTLTPLAVVTHRGVRLDDLRRLFDLSYPALGQAIGAGAFVPSGPALAIYHGDVSGEFDLEVGFPVAAPLDHSVETAAGELHGSALPSGRVAVVSHVGSYDGLGEAWAALVQNADGSPAGTSVEVYVSDPSSTPADQLRTDLVLPLLA